MSATIEALLELGYARTTVKEICQRAKLSHGALFRFFPTLPDLVLAGAEEIGKRRIADFEARFAKAKTHRDPNRAALSLLREACRSPTNMVFYELLVAARTDDELRRRLRRALQRYHEAIRESALKVPAVDKLDPQLRDAVVFAVIHLFDGESLVRSVLPQPVAEDARLALLANGLDLISGQGRGAFTEPTDEPPPTRPRKPRTQTK
ncbi:MAG TPA: TetR/AcrR family transcriptional regulator [Polyangiales bacterium]